MAPLTYYFVSPLINRNCQLLLIFLVGHLSIGSTFSTHLNLAFNSGPPNASSISNFIFQYFLPLRSCRFDLQNNPEMSAFIVQIVINRPREDYKDKITTQFENIDISYSHFRYTNLGQEALLNNKVNCT